MYGKYYHFRRAMKTLSSVKPRERMAIATTRDLLHTRYVASVEELPRDALQAEQAIEQIKKDTVQQFLDRETQRQYEETMRLSEANKIVLDQVREQINQ